VGTRLGIPRTAVRTAVRTLLAERELTYTSHFGCSFLEPSFQRPVLISKYVVVKPPDCHYLPKPHEVVVSLAAGSAFGSGEHPTSRLAVRGIEHLCAVGDIGVGGGAPVLDVGTGSGILVIVSVLFGIQRGMGIDIDACARSEAVQNVRLNRLEDRIKITGDPVDTLKGPYNLITANLRSPTLARLADRLTRLSASDGALVFSGVRPGEMADLQRIYTERGLACRWRKVENDWGAMAFCRRR